MAVYHAMHFIRQAASTKAYQLAVYNSKCLPLLLFKSLGEMRVHRLPAAGFGGLFPDLRLRYDGDFKQWRD